MRILRAPKPPMSPACPPRHMEPGEFGHALALILSGDNRVPAIHRFCFVPGQFHCDRARHAGALEVANSGHSIFAAMSYCSRTVQMLYSGCRGLTVSLSF